MLKWILTLTVIITLSLFAAFYYADVITDTAQWLWGLDDKTRAKVKDWLEVITLILGILGAIFGAAYYIFSSQNKSSSISSKVQPEKIKSEPIVKEKYTPPTKPNTLYYQKLYQACEQIDLALIDVKFTEYAHGVKRISLPTVYQEMDALPCQSETSDRRDSNAGMHLKSEERKPLIEACADENNRLIILGEAGSGKSMFIDNLAWQIAGEHIDKRDTRLPETFQRRHVVRVRLRSVALQSQQQAIDVNLLLRAMQESIAALLQDEEDANYIWQPLETEILEQGVILLDGLDEVPETDNMRLDMLKAIDGLGTKLGAEARLIISSRPYVFEGGHSYWLKAYHCLELQAMSNTQIAAFIQNWYLLLRESRSYSEALAINKARDLFLDLEDRPYLLDPARRPLILTLLTSLHFARGILPHSRSELYRDAIELMLERWTQRTHRENPDYPLEDYERKVLAESDVSRKLALQKLAIDAHRKQTLQIDDRQIKGLFSDYVSEDCNASNLLDFVRYRSGILKPGQGNHFEFYHRTFQAYLAALDIADTGEWSSEIDRLLREEGKDWWGEVALLIISIKVTGSSKSDAMSFLLRYVPEVIDYKTYKDTDWQWLFFAAEALVEQKKPLQGYQDSQYIKLKRLLSKHLTHLIDEEYQLDILVRSQAGRLLGELGDPREGVTVLKTESGEIKRFHGFALPDISWCTIDAGELRMGFTEEEAKEAWEKTSTPDHTVSVDAFQISRYPITNAQYACFVEAGGYKDEQFWCYSQDALDWLAGQPADLSLLDDLPDYQKQVKNWLAQERSRKEPWYWENKKWNNPNHPVVGISWYEAVAFCHWLQSTDPYQGKNIQLPSEIEWEYAARGKQGFRYSWGNTEDKQLGNYADTGLDRTSTVGLFTAGKAWHTTQQQGIYDLSGNVWEWTRSQWGTKAGSPDYRYENWAADDQKKDRNKLDERALRIIRGGAFNDTSDYLRCAFRFRNTPDLRFNDVGFRLVVIES